MHGTIEKDPKLIAKLLKVKNLMDGATTEGEKIAAAGMFKKIMDENALTMSDIEYAAHLATDPVGMTLVDNIEYKRKRQGWGELLAAEIADAHHCRYLISARSNNIWFVGRLSHREAAAWVYATLHRFVEKQAQADYDREFYKLVGQSKAPLRGFQAAWRNGFLHAIAQRYEAERLAQVQQAQESGNSFALVRLQTAKDDANAYVEEKYGKKGKLSSATIREAYNQLGFDKGRDAGRSAVTRSNGIGSGTQTGGRNGLLKA